MAHVMSHTNNEPLFAEELGSTGGLYFVVTDDAGVVSCTCNKWREDTNFAPEKRTCKHIMAAIARMSNALQGPAFGDSQIAKSPEAAEAMAARAKVRAKLAQAQQAQKQAQKQEAEKQAAAAQAASVNRDIQHVIERFSRLDLSE